MCSSRSECSFTAKFAFVSVSEFTYCIEIYFVVLSKWCKVCTANLDEWQHEHEKNCDKNFHGSSPAMEVEDWIIF